MNPSPPRLQAALQSALQRIRAAARQAAERTGDSLGLAALSARSIRERDDLLAAQFELGKRIARFTQAFDDTLDQRVLRALRPQGETTSPGRTSWETLSLVEDREVEAQVTADRFGLAIQHECEWELRELDAYIGSLLRLPRADHERNPLRPEAVGLALVAGAEAVSERPEVRKVLLAELGRTLTSLMRATYADIVADLRSAGVQPMGLALHTRGARGGSTMHGEEGDSETLGLPSESGRVPLDSRHGALGAAAGHGSVGGSLHGGLQGGGITGRGAGFGASRSGAATGSPGYGGGPTIGVVDAQLMGLIRRLAYLGNVSDSLGGTAGAGGGPATGGDPAAALGAGGVASGWGSVPANLILAHREELRQASTGALDHMVIDVVGSLFEQILSDPKVPPQMARQLARLQLPVLRVALGDVSFFSSRRHPVRRFVNRIASLACAFEDLGDGPGLEFLGRVKALVNDIVTGDFDQMAVYEQQLQVLEDFIAHAAEAEVDDDGGTAALLQHKEQQLVQQQRYMQQLQSALTAVEMQDFLRDFLAQVWSQAIVQAQLRDGEGQGGGGLATRLRHAARELVMSVQPKGTPAERKAFLMQLPQLMKDLNEGMALVGWPEGAKKAFFGQLLPLHAESLKGQSMRQLDYNLLVKQLDTILAAPLPEAPPAPAPGMPPPAALLPVLDDVVLPDAAFSDDEKQRIGLLPEAAVDWSGEVDIDLSAEPALTEVDINIDGLPPPEPVEPTQGRSLADHVQIGFAYQMHIEGQWQKVRLSYVSPGRAFFVFTRGRKHQKTISLTHRMLVRLCDTHRLRAFENAYLIERATARARRQLASLGGAGTTRH
jgi:hypothetical protein